MWILECIILIQRGIFVQIIFGYGLLWKILNFKHLIINLVITVVIIFIQFYIIIKNLNIILIAFILIMITLLIIYGIGIKDKVGIIT